MLHKNKEDSNNRDGKGCSSEGKEREQLLDL